MAHPIRAKQPPTALRRYMQFVADGVGAKSLWNDLRGQPFLGDEDFVAPTVRIVDP